MEPITRTEMYLSKRENLPAPITREERFLAKLAGMDVVTPTPITREEMFLDAAADNGGGTGGGTGGGSGGSSEDWIGDGNTHIWITLHEGRTSPMLGVCPNGTVAVDWGDGTTPDILTGTSTSTVVWTPNHEYAKPGDYIITLTVDGKMGFHGKQDTSQGSGILRCSSGTDIRNVAYQAAVQKIEIGEGITFIGTCAFYGCYSLTSVVIPESVTSIGTYAFYGCYTLTSIVIPESITSIGNYAFGACYSLSSIVIPDSVTSIGGNAFSHCYSLTSVAIPESVTSLSTHAFDYCNSLTSVVIPESITSIGSHAFNYCYSLASIVIPDGVTSIGSQAFYYCHSLTSVVIPGGVTSINNSLFGYCYGVRYFDFTACASVPTLKNTSAFDKIPDDCEIRVPAALYDEWIAATNWTSKASQIVAV